jgi:pilus assembly protein CpaF
VFDAAKQAVHSRLVERIDLENIPVLGAARPGTSDAQLRAQIRGEIERICSEEDPSLNGAERTRLVDEVLDEALGFGPLEPLLRDESILDIMVNSPKDVYIEQRDARGRSEMKRCGVTFRDDAHLMHIINRIVSLVGRRVDESSPMVDARLPNGSRFNAIIPPLALRGPTVSIRKFGTAPLTVDKLLEFRSITPEMLEFLKAAIQARLSVVVSGGTGSGKTTLLNALSRFIPPEERIITIEDSAELQLQREHVVSLETRPANLEGRGEVTAMSLVKNALRMRPDRIIVGECRGVEALDMIQAMNTGHEGSMTTIHANTPADALIRLEHMISRTGIDLPIVALRQQFVSAFDLIVQANRVQGGARRITRICEVTHMEGDAIQTRELFAYRQRGVDECGFAIGQFVATGARPTFLDRLAQKGFSVPEVLFQERVLADA